MSSEYLNNYKPLVKFLAEVLGANCEIVLHDLEKDYMTNYTGKTKDGKDLRSST